MSTEFHLRVPARLYRAALTQARAGLPNEVCGLFAGPPARPADPPATAGPRRVAEVVERYPLTNVLASPIAFEADARDTFEALRDMRRRGLEILAIYHSHPTSAPVPSRHDLERNFSPDVMNLIISPAGWSVDAAPADAAPAVRGWWLTETDFRAASWEVVGPDDEPSSASGGRSVPLPPG